MGLISVIVPIYNVEKYIKRCVDSIIVQTFEDFELILVDDGSTDNCGVICDEYASHDSRIHVIHQKNGGLSAARNAGIDWAFANSDSEWLSFIDSDDWVHPYYLEALHQGAILCGVDVVIGDFERTESENPCVDESKIVATMQNVEDFYCEHCVTATVAWGKLYRKECFKRIRYPVGRIHEDEFVTYRILFRYDKVAVINQPLYAYYQRKNSIMQNRWSVRNVDAIWAHREQMLFFKREGYKNAYRKQIEAFCVRTVVALYELEQSPENTGLRKTLKKIVRREMLFNHKYYKIEGHEQIYKKAFPIMMELYWIVQAQLKKMRKL